MDISPLDQVSNICREVLNAVKLPKKFNHIKCNHWIEIVFLYIVCARRINFTWMGRCGRHSEQTYRNFMNKSVPFFLEANTYIADQLIPANSRKAIAIDPCYIPKAGKKTPGLGIYWSGCAGMAKRGLELLGVAAIDVDNHKSVALKAIQTPSKEKRDADGFDTLEKWYLNTIVSNGEQLKKYSNIIVADAQFSTAGFAAGLEKEGFHLVSRFRNNTVLRYLYEGERTGRRGHPKEYDGMVDIKDLDLNRMEKVEVEDGEAYSLLVNAQAMKRIVKLVVWIDGNDNHNRKLYFSTDTSMSAKDIIDIYRSRFQIEFAYRDAKQHMGLTHCQSRHAEALENAFNFSLFACNVAKLQIKREKWNISIASYKSLICTLFMVRQFSAGCARLSCRTLIRNIVKDHLSLAA